MWPSGNPGVLFDSTCSLNEHVDQSCQNVNYQLYSIGKVRKHLDKTMTEIPYGHFIVLYGTKRYSVFQLCYQNNAAHIMPLWPTYNHMMLVLKELHWLPVQLTRACKILLWPTRLHMTWFRPTCRQIYHLSNIESLYDLGQTSHDSSILPARFW